MYRFGFLLKPAQVDSVLTIKIRYGSLEILSRTSHIILGLKGNMIQHTASQPGGGFDDLDTLE